jgi:hypothetical protein
MFTTLLWCDWEAIVGIPIAGVKVAEGDFGATGVKKE